MQFSKKVLPNGLRLITVPMKDNPTVTVLVLVEAGSKYETKKINGVSHFLEHLCFKGTTKRPRAADIVRELDGIGSQYNAFTAQEMTGYFAKSDRKHFSGILDVVSDIYLHSTFPEAELEKEKGVIVEETDQVHLALALRTCDLYSEDITGMRVVSAVLGGGMSSRLFQKMRDELGICYYVGAVHES